MTGAHDGPGGEHGRVAPAAAPIPLIDDERAPLELTASRLGRAVPLLALFGLGGAVGSVLAFGPDDYWYPFLGVALLLAAIVAWFWASARCPRCGARPLAGRVRLPAACPRCGVPFERPGGDGSGRDVDRTPFDAG